MIMDDQITLHSIDENTMNQQDYDSIVFDDDDDELTKQKLDHSSDMMMMMIPNDDDDDKQHGQQLMFMNNPQQQRRPNLVHSVSIIVEPAVNVDVDEETNDDDSFNDDELRISPIRISERRKTIAGPISVFEDLYYGKFFLYFFFNSQKLTLYLFLFRSA